VSTAFVKSAEKGKKKGQVQPTSLKNQRPKILSTLVKLGEYKCAGYA
jgi:hypothetical protein